VHYFGEYQDRNKYVCKETIGRQDSQEVPRRLQVSFLTSTSRVQILPAAHIFSFSRYIDKYTSITSFINQIYHYSTHFHRLFFKIETWILHQIRSDQCISPAEKPPFLGVPSDVVYSFVLGIKWKLRMSRFRICMMPPWHPWAFCAIQDGVQDGRQFKQTSRTPLLHRAMILVSNPMFLGQGIHWNG
jgi:hypothetical protein